MDDGFVASFDTLDLFFVLGVFFLKLGQLMAEKNIFILEVFDFDFVGIDLTGLKFGCFDLHLKLVDIGVGLSDVFFSFNEMSSEGVELNIESIDLLHKEDDFKCFSTVIFYNFVKLFTIDS